MIHDLVWCHVGNQEIITMLAKLFGHIFETRFNKQISYYNTEIGQI